MHDTALKIGKLFVENYVSAANPVIIDVGAMDVNGSIRIFAPNSGIYIGVDLEHGPGVDLVVKLDEPLPFRDGFADAVISSSQLEHDDFFWQTFVEFIRVLKPGGYLYINTPSNGEYHRYPNDNWRFYPDCAHVLIKWAKRHGYDVALCESFIALRQGDQWNDFVAVFVRGSGGAPPGRLISDQVPAQNIWRRGAAEPEAFDAISEDMAIHQAQRTEIAALRAEMVGLREEIDRMKAMAKAEPTAPPAPPDTPQAAP